MQRAAVFSRTHCRMHGYIVQHNNNDNRPIFMTQFIWGLIYKRS